MTEASRPEGRELAKEVLGRYRGLPLGLRLFLRVRWAWTPYRAMADRMPVEGRLLDGGCGHGLFSLALALSAPTRQVLGLDHSEQRIAAATAAGRGTPNLTFQTGDYSNIPGGAYAGIALIDCLHYLPLERQVDVFRECFARLASGGLLLFREVDRRPGLASSFNRLHERIMTGIGFTKAGGLHYRDPQGWKEAAQSCGFTVKFQPFGRFPFADLLFECRKP